KAALKLVPEFSNDPSRYVVEGTMSIVDNIGEHLATGDLRPSFERFVRQTYGTRAREFGWTPKAGEDDNTRLLRPRLLQVDSRRGADLPLVAEAQRLAERWLEDRASLAPEMVAPVLDTSAQFGDQALFDRFHAAAKKETNPRDRRLLLTAMGQFRDPAVAK